jgi:hypothetical protein
MHATSYLNLHVLQKGLQGIGSTTLQRKMMKEGLSQYTRRTTLNYLPQLNVAKSFNNTLTSQVYHHQLANLDSVKTWSLKRLVNVVQTIFAPKL